MKACSNKCSHCRDMGNVRKSAMPNHSGKDLSTVPFNDTYVGMELIVKNYQENIPGKVIGKERKERNYLTIEWYDGIVTRTVNGKHETFTKIFIK